MYNQYDYIIVILTDKQTLHSENCAFRDQFLYESKALECILARISVSIDLGFTNQGTWYWRDHEKINFVWGYHLNIKKKTLGYSDQTPNWRM